MMLASSSSSSSPYRRRARRASASPKKRALAPYAALVVVFALVGFLRRRRTNDDARLGSLDAASAFDASSSTLAMRRAGYPSDATTRGDPTFAVEPLSWTPRAFALRNVLTERECDDVIKEAKHRVSRSTVLDSATGESKVDEIRTSKQTFLLRQTPIVQKIFARISTVTMLPWTHNEDMQVLEYGVGEKYGAHEDVGDDDSKSGQKLASEGGKRVATVLLYLNEPEEGGETAFPDSEWIDATAASGETWSKCAEGRVAMKPKKGDGLLFWSVAPDGSIDHRALHTGCPVVRGVKWTATIWVHATPYRWKAPPAPKAPPGCEDKHEQCRGWANTDECEKNPTFMLENCKWSCRVPGCVPAPA